MTSPQYQIFESVIGKKLENGRLKFLVTWYGCPLSESTWEPAKNFKDLRDLYVKSYNFEEKCKFIQKERRKEFFEEVVSEKKPLEMGSETDPVAEQPEPSRRDKMNNIQKNLDQIQAEDRNMVILCESEENQADRQRVMHMENFSTEQNMERFFRRRNMGV